MYVLTQARQFVAEPMFKASLPPVRRWLRGRWETEADTPPFLYGLGQNELTKRELDYRDPDHEMVITLRAQKELPA